MHGVGGPTGSIVAFQEHPCLPKVGRCFDRSHVPEVHARQKCQIQNGSGCTRTKTELLWRPGCLPAQVLLGRSSAES